MGPFLLINAALVGFFAFAALYHLILWTSSRRETLLAVFAADCTMRAIFSLVVMGMLSATTIEQAQTTLHLRLAVGALIMVTWVWSLSLISEIPMRWFVWPITVVFLTIFLWHTFFYSLNATVISVDEYTLPWGEIVASPQMDRSRWWFGPIYILVVTTELYGFFCGYKLWLRDRVAGLLIILATTTLLILHLGHVLRIYGFLNVPFLGILGHTFWAGMVGLVIARRNVQMRDRLAESEERFRALVEHGSEGINIIDAHGTLIYAGPSNKSIMGYSADETHGRSAFEWVHPEDLSRCRESFAQVLNGPEKIQTICLRSRHKDGTWHWMEVSACNLMRHRSVQGIVLNWRDVTQRKLAEEEHQKFEAQLRHAQKLESLGVLAGGIAHDFNNLLTVVLGNASLAQAQLTAKSPATALIHEIEQAARRAAELTQQMLAYSGRGKFIVQPLRLDHLVQEMATLLKTIVSKKATITLELQPSAIEGDATQIRQVIMNLIMNASDALEGDATRICIRTGVRHVRESELQSPYLPGDLPEGLYAFFEVEDAGIGMSDETQTRIFEPFFTTKFTGRGLGLAAVLGIVRGHRGTIKVESALHQGTTFQVLIPATSKTELQSPDSGHEILLPTGKGTVLVIDDEVSILSFVRHVLEREGFVVLTAEDGREGLQILATHATDIVMVLLDLTMPRMDGAEALRELHSTAPQIPVLVMSGFSVHEELTQSRESGVRGFIQKPFTPRRLIARIAELLQEPSVHEDHV